MKINRQFIILSVCGVLAGCASNAPEEPEPIAQTPQIQAAPPTTTVNVPAPPMPMSAAPAAKTSAHVTATPNAQKLGNSVSDIAERIRNASTKQDTQAAWLAAYEKKRYYDQIMRSAAGSNDSHTNYASGMFGAHNHLMNAADRQERSPGDPLVNIELNAALQLADMAETSRQQAIWDAQNPQAATQRKAQEQQEFQQFLIDRQKS